MNTAWVRLREITHDNWIIASKTLNRQVLRAVSAMEPCVPNPDAWKTRSSFTAVRGLQ